VGIIDRILGRNKDEKIKLQDSIVRYELYEKEPNGEWRLLRSLPEVLDFDQIEDAMPGCSYRLYSRHKSGKFKILWHEHLEGPGPLQEATSTSFEDLKSSLELLIKWGKAIGDLREGVRDTFGWLFPERQQSSGWSWTEQKGWVYQQPALASRDKTFGEAPKVLFKLCEEAVYSANRITMADYKALLAQQRERARPM